MLPPPTTSPGQFQQLLMEELGQFDHPLLAVTVQSVLWDLYADKGVLAPRLQYLFCKRHALDWLAGQMRPPYPASDEDRADYQLTLQRLDQLRDAAEAEVRAVEARASANRAAVVGQPTATSPISGPDLPLPLSDRFSPDPNDRRYRGDPRRR